jgi:putative ABC transport system ATP-binding protein
MTDLIRIVSLSRSYHQGDENIHALRSVDLRVQKGEFLCITGASGSGKSTLLYIIGLLEKETKGEYFFEEKSTVSLSDTERARIRNQRMGFVFQSFHLLPRASALQNVYMPLEYAQVYGAKLTKIQIQDRARQALDKVGLSDRIYHRPNQLSGGQRQRVAIARALVNNPTIILADEPTGNLDVKSSTEIMNLFQTLSREGKTILMVTHNQDFVRYASSHIVVNNGQIVGSYQVG